MEKIFLSVLNMSLTASFIISAIMLARFPLKKAPKIISYVLWAVAGFRLVFPFTLESVFSLLPFKAVPIPTDIAMQAVPRIDSGITIIDNAISASLPAVVPHASVNPLQIWIFIGSCIWLFGIAVMLIYSFVSIILLKRRLHGAALIEGNLYEAGNLKTPFVIGLFSPKIYIPAGLTDEERNYIVLHEQTHIRRGDHIVKMFAYFVLCLHWFNPFVWIAFILMGTDMEMSCDERVMRELGGEIKNAYSLSLVRVATGHKILNSSPLAFGEGGMKERVKNVLNFKKPSRVIITFAVILVVVLSVGFAVNKVSGSLPFQDLKADEINSISLFCIPPEVTVVIDDRATIEEIVNTLQTVVTYEKDNSGHEYAGQLVQYTLTMQSGETLEIGAYNPFVFINGQCYRTKYEPCEELNRLGNQLRGDKQSHYQQAMDIINEHYPEASEVISSGSETISYADSPESIDVYTFDVVINGERIICAISKDNGIFLTYNDITGWALPSLGDRRPMVLIEDLIYMDTGKEVSVETDKITTLGTILSSVDLSEVPTKNGQSNFGCIGSDYAYYEDGIIVKISDKWIFFVAKNVNLGNATSQNEEVAQRVEDGLRIIMSSPLTSSNPQDYINEHNEEYEDLAFKYSEGVLEYLLSQFEVGNTDGLRGQIMMLMCKDMLGLQNNVTDESLSPQEWYKRLSIISEIKLPDFKPENPTGVYDGVVDGEVYEGLVNSAIVQRYGNSERGFLVYALTFYGAYEEEGKLKAFVTVHYEYNRLYGKTLEHTGGGVIPGAIVFSKDSRTDEWVFEDYLEVGTRSLPDGAYSGDSMKKLCVMPVSGDEIAGLVDEMNSDYVRDTRRELLAQSLREHLMSQGQRGVSLKTPGGEMIPLT